MVVQLRLFCKLSLCTLAALATNVNRIIEHHAKNQMFHLRVLFIIIDVSSDHDHACKIEER